MKKKVKKLDDLVNLLRDFKNKKKKIILVHGVFDIFHYGHLQLLTKAKKLADILVIGIENDQNVKDFKGPQRPYNNQKLRIDLIANLEIVDYVFLISKFNNKNLDKFYEDLYLKINPNIVASGTGTSKYDEIKRKQVQKLGMRFVGIKNTNTISSTKILKDFGLE